MNEGQLRYRLAGIRRVRVAALCGTGPVGMLELMAWVPAAGGAGCGR
jgi:hypothetical protein